MRVDVRDVDTFADRPRVCFLRSGLTSRDRFVGSMVGASASKVSGRLWLTQLLSYTEFCASMVRPATRAPISSCTSTQSG